MQAMFWGVMPEIKGSFQPLVILPSRCDDCPSRLDSLSHIVIDGSRPCKSCTILGVAVFDTRTRID
jgi:hypothetical protein